MKAIKEEILKRITMLMGCDATKFIQAAIELEQENNPRLSSLEAQGRVMMNIIDLKKDQVLSNLWEIYSQGELQ